MREIAGILNAEGMSFGIVVSRFNSFFTSQLLEGAMDCIERHGGSADKVTLIRVPGANEIPLMVGKLAARGGQNAIIALGCVVQGATPHADMINTQTARALAALALENDLPVINGIVSANNLEQAIERSGTKAGNKGWDAALAAIEMASLSKILD